PSRRRPGHRAGKAVRVKATSTRWPVIPLSLVTALSALPLLDPRVECHGRRRLAHSHMVQPQTAQLGNEGLMTLDIITTDNQRQLWVCLAQTRDEAFGGIDPAVLFVLAIAVAPCFYIQWQYSVRTRFHQRGRDHRVTTMPFSMGSVPLHTARTRDVGRVK